VFACASVSVDGYAFFAENVTNACFIGRYAGSRRPESVGDEAFDREHAVDVRHGVAVSANPLADCLSTLSGTARFRCAPYVVQCPSGTAAMNAAARLKSMDAMREKPTVPSIDGRSSRGCRRHAATASVVLSRDHTWMARRFKDACGAGRGRRPRHQLLDLESEPQIGCKRRYGRVRLASAWWNMLPAC
jgi:hypothetical protein